MTAGITVAIPTAAQAAAVSASCSETALVDAINTANRLSGSDTLNLADGCTYKLTSSHGGTGNGLPVITSVIELVGRPNIITRSGGFFRIAEVSSTGNFTLTRVALDNGSTTGSGGGVPEPRRGDVHQRRQRPDNNTAGLFGTGGGLSNVDTPSGTAPAATFTGASVMGNTAGGRGGGIYNGNEDALTMTSTPSRTTGARWRRAAVLPPSARQPASPARQSASTTPTPSSWAAPAASSARRHDDERHLDDQRQHDEQLRGEHSCGAQLHRLTTPDGAHHDPPDD